MLNLFLLSLVVIYTIDVSGFVDDVVKFFYDKYVKIGDYHKILPKLKPLTCGTCMTFWSGVIYLIATGTFTFPMLAYVCLLSLLALPIGDIMAWLRETLKAICNLLYKLIGQK